MMVIVMVAVAVVAVAGAAGAITAGCVLAVLFRVRAASRPRAGNADHVVCFALIPPEVARALHLAASFNSVVPAAAAAAAPAPTRSRFLIVAS